MQRIRKAGAALAALISGGLAQAQFAYIDSDNPKGIPDLTGDNLGGICGAVALADVFWRFGSYDPYNAAAKPLVQHADANDYAKWWGRDSDVLRDGIADRLYGRLDARGKRTGGAAFGTACSNYAYSKGHAYNKRTNPNGLSMKETQGWSKIKYSDLNAMVQVQGQDNKKIAVLGIEWYKANGDRILRPANLGGGARYHAIVLAGMDDRAKKIAVSNPWDDHASTPRVQNEPAAPVSTNWYDEHTLDAAEITADDRIIIKKAAGGNAAFVTHYSDDADYAKPISMYVVKKGGSPNVVGTIRANGGSQSLRYVVENPDSPVAIAKAYIILDPTVINVAQARAGAQAWLTLYEPAWSVELLNPNAGADANLFRVTGEDTDPNPSNYALDEWQCGAAGLVFSTSAGHALQIGQSVTLGFDYPGNVSPLLWENAYAAADIDSTEAWWGVTGVRCFADFNLDGAVDFFDYLDFVDAFSLGLPSADIDGDTMISFFDYLDFVDGFSDGC